MTDNSNNFPGKWYFNEMKRVNPRDKTLAIDNFLLEGKHSTDILVREIVQNVLDVRKNSSEGNKVTATLKLSVLSTNNQSLSKGALEKYCGELIPRLHAADQGMEITDEKFHAALLFEEFGTTGLIGETEDSFYEGDDRRFQRWNNFWHGEGDPSKTAKDLGRRGQGKITYHMLSRAASVFALSNQENEKKDLLFGKCIFTKTYKYEEKNFTRHAFFCDTKLIESDTQPVPISEKSIIEKFKKDFHITRDQNDDGTSWLIPYIPQDEITQENLKKVIVSEFFVAIMNGDIIFEVEGSRIDAANLLDLVEEINFDTVEKKNFVSWLINSVNNPKYTMNVGKDWFDKSRHPARAEAFQEDELNQIREAFSNGESVKFLVPIKLQLRGEEAVYENIEVYLNQMPEAKATSEMYVRDCLCIEQEKHLRDAPGKYFGAMLARDELIIDFLGSAEKASHLEWNQKAEDLKKYSDALTSLSMVRNSLPSLAMLLSNLQNQSRKDILIDLISVPMPQEKQKKKKKTPKTRGGTKSPPAIFDRSHAQGKLSIFPGAGFSRLSPPVEVEFEIAYQSFGEGNSFKAYTHFDFDLSDKATHKINTRDCNLNSADLNIIELMITGNNFLVEISGFTDDPLVIKQRS